MRLAARGVTASDVVGGDPRQQLPRRTGQDQERVTSPTRSRCRRRCRRRRRFATLPIRANGDQVVRLRDVADVELGPKSTDTKVSFNGKEGTFIGIFPTPAANPLDTSPPRCTKAVDQIQATLPQGHDDRARLRRTELHLAPRSRRCSRPSARRSLIVVVVILLFLGSFRSVLMPIVTIPLSLIGVCFVLFALGYSINLLSLLAMVLAIGLVVDDAIVVVENIHRHIEEGLTPMRCGHRRHEGDLRPDRRHDDHARGRVSRRSASRRA